MIEEEDVEIGDETPSLKEQARLNGWKADLFDFGKGEQAGVSYFNPGLVRRPDGLWLIARRSVDTEGMIYGKNDICAFKLENLKPTVGYPLTVPDSQPGEQFEDPRAFRWGEQTWLGMVNFTWFDDGSWTGAHQCLASFRDDEEWTPIVRRDPPVETNLGQAGHTGGRHNKNFLWFIHDAQLHLIYTSDPWHVVSFGASWDEQTHYKDEGARWKYGHIRGGTTPVLIGDHFWTFFHSSMPWRGRYRRYYMGALAFEAKPPFKPVLVTHEPLLVGSQNDPWHQRKPLVVFPCGALIESDTWLVSYGVNDLKSGWAQIPHEDVVKLTKPKPPTPVTALLGTKTPVPVYERVQRDNEAFPVTKGESSGAIVGVAPKSGAPPALPLRSVENFISEEIKEDGRKAKLKDNLAKARAELARKRALGLVKMKPRRKKKRRALTEKN